MAKRLGCKWEYLDVSLDTSSKTDKSVVDQLNWQGAADWELVQIIVGNPSVAFFKRPVSEEASVGERAAQESDETDHEI